MSPSASHYLPDLTGEWIDDGSLELLCLLGSGAYGKVYKALDTDSTPDNLIYYAVKCMPRYEQGSREAEIQENELMVHRMVSDHPRVITFHRQFATDEFVFVVLEFAPGDDVFSAMVDRHCYHGKPALIKQVLGELIDAVEFCHRNSVYHRDLKPENILCNSAGTDIRLADFGLSTQISVSTQFGCGSRFYMSPESIDPAYANGCYLARHSDLWALSVIFTNMISGRHPWSSAEMSDPGFAAFRSDMLEALEITRPAHALLKRCYHMNPLRRPTLHQFRDAVNAIESFSLDEVVTPEPVLSALRLPMKDFPIAVSTSLEWVVATPSDMGESYLLHPRLLVFLLLSFIVFFPTAVLLTLPVFLLLAPIIRRVRHKHRQQCRRLDVAHHSRDIPRRPRRRVREQYPRDRHRRPPNAVAPRAPTACIHPSPAQPQPQQADRVSYGRAECPPDAAHPLQIMAARLLGKVNMQKIENP
ncbi:kinase-like domain-containing protein [Mycena maculata]|uniref:Kinase-like domain-containing protein n=1 Tax=Mycena maculata TaxID=230809 RepID=A0AAD7K0F3_9AGAR|nr:kinase-like domain-containing protein [Mycena maculata]